MERNDRQAIEGLFEKLAAVERQAPPRDAEAEAFIRERIAGQPGAPYFMAQTIVVQEQALSAAQARIEALEREASTRSTGGGLFSGLFGDSRPPRSGSVPSVGRATPPPPPGPDARDPAYARRGGGGFLAGAAQTAMGVAGGVLLGNAIAGMLSGDEAHAAEPPAEDPGMDDAGFDDGGGFDDDLGF